MTEAEFENHRNELWHAILKPEVVIPLLPETVEWATFWSDVKNAAELGKDVAYPDIDSSRPAVQRAIASWKTISGKVLTLLDDMERIEYLRPLPESKPSRDDVVSWLDACSRALDDLSARKGRGSGKEFWIPAIELIRYVLALENGTDTFWKHFEQVY